MKKDLYNKIFAPSDCLSKQLMTGYLKGTLNEEETHKVEEHLVDCELCSEALDGLMLVKNETVLNSVSHDVKRMIYSQQGNRRVSSLGVWIAAAASFAIIIASVIAIRNIDNNDNKQIAANEIKAPTKDSSQALTKNSEPINSETIIKSRKEENIQSETQQLKTIKAPVPKKSDVVSQVASTSTSDDQSVVANHVEGTESELAFSDKNVEEIENKSQSTRSNSAIEPPSGNLNEIKTFSSKQAADNSKVSSVEQIAYIHDLKIIDYSTEKDVMLQAPANNTEAKYATPEVKNEAGAASLEESLSYKDLISPALEAFKQQKYSVAVSFLNNVLSNNPGDLNAKFYSGMSYYHLKNHSKSLEFLLPLIKKNDNAFFEEAKFYLALNYIELNEKNKATKLLNEVIALNSFYKQRAEEMLKSIK